MELSSSPKAYLSDKNWTTPDDTEDNYASDPIPFNLHPSAETLLDADGVPELTTPSTPRSDATTRSLQLGLANFAVSPTVQVVEARARRAHRKIEEREEEDEDESEDEDEEGREDENDRTYQD